jgi:biotin synthase
MMSTSSILDRIQKRQELTPEQATELFSDAFDPQRPQLFAHADAVRREHVGDDVYLRGLIEFSNFCACRCSYCGISALNPEIERYRMAEAEIMETIKLARQLGYTSFVMQSGEDPAFSSIQICRILERIKQEHDVAITLSCGEWKKEEYASFKAAGADRFLLRIETSDPRLFAQFHPDSSWEKRHQCLIDLKELGYQVGSGILVGLPGQDGPGLWKDLEYLKKLEPEMVGIGPFIPHPQTPLAASTGGKLKDCLTFLALLRVYLPDSFLPATTAMGSIDPLGRQKALQAGANVLMPNVSPLSNRAKYELYPSKICLADDASVCRGCTERMVVGMGRKINLGKGHIKRKVY